MATLTIKDVDSRFDGVYPCDDLFQLTHRERLQLRQISKVYPAEALEAFWKGDSGVAIALAMIVLQRNGKLPEEEPFLSASGADSIVFDFTSPGAVEESPPAQPPNGGNANGNDTGNDVASDSSGTPTGKSSESPTAVTPPDTGSPGSETTAASDRVTSLT